MIILVPPLLNNRETIQTCHEWYSKHIKTDIFNSIQLGLTISNLFLLYLDFNVHTNAYNWNFKSFNGQFIQAMKNSIQFATIYNHVIYWEQVCPILHMNWLKSNTLLARQTFQKFPNASQVFFSFFSLLCIEGKMKFYLLCECFI